MGDDDLTECLSIAGAGALKELSVVCGREILHRVVSVFLALLVCLCVVSLCVEPAVMCEQLAAHLTGNHPDTTFAPRVPEFEMRE
jgi:hypothetical protein